MPKWYKTGEPTLWLRIRNRLEEVFRFLPKVHDVLEPEIVGVVDANFVYNLLKAAEVSVVFLSDEQYQVTNRVSVERFLALDETDKVKYVAIWHDCDDFSFRLMGQFHRGKWACLGVGIAWSRTHAFNIIILEDKLFLIEPQTDEILTIEEAGDAYKPLKLVIM